MKLYRYDPENLSYIGWIDIPDEDVQLYSGPGYTAVEPPEATPGMGARWSGSEWELAADHRSEGFHDPTTGEEVVITAVGQLPPEGWVPGLAPRPTTPAPGEHYRWDYETRAWVDARTLEQAKADKWVEIKAARDGQEFGGFTWDGSTFDSDAISQSRIQGVVQLAQLATASGQPFSIDWTLADNSVRTLSAADATAVGLALGAHVQAAHTSARAIRQQIEAATTLEDVMAIGWASA